MSEEYEWRDCNNCGRQEWVPDTTTDLNCRGCGHWNVIAFSRGWAPTWAQFLHP